VTGLLFFGYGLFEYGFWRNGGPGAGFFPAVFGAGAALLAAISLSRRNTDSDSVGVQNFLPVVAVAIAIFAIPLVGMIAAMSLLVVLWLAVVERRGWRLALGVGLSTGVTVFLLFSIWLQVSFPPSVLFDRF
jgi:hypothetical protein